MSCAWKKTCVSCLGEKSCAVFLSRKVHGACIYWLVVMTNSNRVSLLQKSGLKSREKLNLNQDKSWSKVGPLKKHLHLYIYIYIYIYIYAFFSTFESKSKRDGFSTSLQLTNTTININKGSNIESLINEQLRHHMFSKV
jgi:hypothetical protein